MTLRLRAPGFSKPLAYLPLLSLLAAILLALPNFLARAELSQPTPATFVTPGEMNTGALLLESEDGFVEASRLDTDVVIDVTGTIARTVVTQRFENPGDAWLEGTYVFPRKIEAWPDPLPNLYAGEPVMLSAKVSSLDGALRLEGMFDGKPWGTTVKLADAIGGSGVGKLWARSKITALETKRFSGSDVSGIDKAIEKVALAHHLVSSQTSLVAIDSAKSRPDGEDVNTKALPLNLPEG